MPAAPKPPAAATAGLMATCCTLHLNLLAAGADAVAAAAVRASLVTIASAAVTVGLWLTAGRARHHELLRSELPCRALSYGREGAGHG